MLRFKYLPNFLTAFRIVCAILILLLYMGDGIITVKICIICILAGGTDLMDGLLARRYGWVTSTGKILDPIADKILTYSVLIIFINQGLLPYWGLGYVLIKDSLINLYRFRKLRYGIVSSAFRLGKYKTAYNSLVFTIVLVSCGFSQQGANMLLENSLMEKLLLTTLI